MDGKEFLDVAKRLHNSAHEADRRTSISRAYYAFFNHVRSCLAAKGIELPPAGAHSKAYEYLRYSDILEAKETAAGLDSLRSKRNEADYDMRAKNITTNNCLLWYMKAEKCVNDFDNINKDVLAEKIIDYKKRTGK